jgi:hypothetical protein
MSEKTTKAKKAKKPIQILRERHGGMSDELKEWRKESRRIKKAIKEQLKTKPMRIPDLAEVIDDPSHLIFYHIIAMKRWENVIETGKDEDDYIIYGLKEKEDE